MCGLVGIAVAGGTKFTEKHTSIFKSLLMMNQMRGRHSTGIAIVPKTLDDCILIKALGGPGNLIKSKAWDDLVQEYIAPGNVAAIFGHGRSATIGKITANNAHPFKYMDGARKMVFMHNGTLHQQQRLTGMTEYETDSEWLGKQVFDLGPKDALEKVDGANASMWFDTKDRQFHVYRNRDRPLCFMQQDNEAFYIASEWCMLDSVNYLFDIGIPEKEINEFAVDGLSDIILDKKDLSFVNSTAKFKFEFSSSAYASSSYWDKHQPEYNSTHGMSLVVDNFDKHNFPSQEMLFQRFNKLVLNSLEVKFRTKADNRTIKHVGKPDHFPYLETYNNNVGDKLVVGDHVITEVFSADVVPGVISAANLPLLRITCFEVGAAAQSCIKYEFYSSKWSENQIIEFGAFKGKVASIRCIPDKESLETGDIMSVISGRLEDFELVKL